MSKYKENLTEKEIIDYELYFKQLKKAADDGLETVGIDIKERFYNIFFVDAKEAGYEVLNVSKGYFNGYLSVFLKKRTDTTVDWQQVRIQAAIAAMQGIMTNYEYIQEFNYSSPNVEAMRKDIAKACRSYADKLVEELKR